MIIRQLHADEPLPWHLLLLADEEKAHVMTYIHHCTLFVLEENGHILAEVAVRRCNEAQFELMNVAVLPAHHRKGFGSMLLTHVLFTLQKHVGKYSVIVKTGDTSVSAIALYTAMGFTVIETVPDYFIHHYAQPIYENGKRLRHQLILQKSIHSP